MFSISDNKGFQITFENGYSVSVQFGPGNYCENKDLPYNHGEEVPMSNTAETALISPDGFVEYRGDDVQGHMSPKDVLELLNYAEVLPTYGEEVKEGSFYGFNEKTDNYVEGLDD
jgi:hypothetical protein